MTVSHMNDVVQSPALWRLAGFIRQHQQPVQVVFPLRLECKCNLSFSKPLVILSVVFQGRHQG